MTTFLQFIILFYFYCNYFHQPIHHGRYFTAGWLNLLPLLYLLYFTKKAFWNNCFLRQSTIYPKTKKKNLLRMGWEIWSTKETKKHEFQTKSCGKFCSASLFYNYEVLFIKPSKPGRSVCIVRPKSMTLCSGALGVSLY